MNLFYRKSMFNDEKFFLDQIDGYTIEEYMSMYENWLEGYYGNDEDGYIWVCNKIN